MKLPFMGTLRNSGICQQKPHQVLQGEVASPALGQNSSMYQGKLGGDRLRSGPEEKAIAATRDAIGASRAC